MIDKNKAPKERKEYKTMAIPEEPGDDAEYKTMAIPEEPADAEKAPKKAGKVFGEG
ncbi:MAG: hypothetical protein IPK80_27160 [Nannocystis sp.]|nr:hypothetical protein [Nannocystis sp.]MBK8265002.1 hypothetical protein [Nannocystis sp.]